MTMTLQALSEILKNEKQNNMVRIQSVNAWYFQHHAHLTQSNPMYDDFLQLIRPYLNLQDEEGNTLMHHFASSGYDKLLNDVVKSCPESVFQCNNHGRYPIHTAIVNNEYSCVSVLLSLNPTISLLEDVKRRCAIHYAALYGNKEMMELCCKNTPILDMCDTDGKTAIILAAERDNAEAQKVLEHYGMQLPLTFLPRMC